MKLLVTAVFALLLAATAASACPGKEGEKGKTKDKTKTEQAS